MMMGDDALMLSAMRFLMVVVPAVREANKKLSPVPRSADDRGSDRRRPAKYPLSADAILASR